VAQAEEKRLLADQVDASHAKLRLVLDELAQTQQALSAATQELNAVIGHLALQGQADGDHRGEEPRRLAAGVDSLPAPGTE
jgi:hypothetical protein